MNIIVYFLFGSFSLGAKALYGHVYVVEIALIMTIICLPLLFLSGGNKRNNRIIALDVLVALFVLFNIISVMVGSESFYESAKHYRYMVLTPGLIYAVVRYIPVSTDVLIRGLYCLVGGTLVQSVFFIRYYWVYGERAENVGSVITDTITMSILLCISICILVYRRNFEVSNYRKVLAMISMVLLFAALIVSATRAPLVATVVLVPFASKIWRSRKLRKLFSGSILGLLVLVLVVVVIKDPSVGTIQVENEREIRGTVERLYTPELYLKDLEERLNMWSRLVWQSLDRPVLGSGSASYRVGSRADVGFQLGSAHNMLISALITSGLPGLLLLLILIGATYHCLNKTTGESDMARALGTTLLVSYTTLILTSLTNDLSGGRAFIFFFLMALAARLSLIDDEPSEPNEMLTRPGVMKLP